MPRRVKGPDGVVRDFPDDATDDEISEALEQSGFDDSGATQAVSAAFGRVASKHPAIPRDIRALRTNPALRASGLDGQYVNGAIEVAPEVTDPNELERLLFHEIAHASGADEPRAGLASRLASLPAMRMAPAHQPQASADAAASPATPDNLTKLLGLLPTAGGIAGGLFGGVGGTAFGFGVGGIPGTVGGATLGGGAGEALRQLLMRVRGLEAPATPLAAAKQIGLEGGVQGASEAAGGLIAKGATSGAKAVYRGYLKPALSERMLPKAKQIVETAINEAIPISRGGMQKAQHVISELNAEVDKIIAGTKGTVDLHTVAQKVRAFAKARYDKPGVDPSDYQAALKVADSLDAHPALNLPPGTAPGPTPVSASAANDSKRGLYTSIKEAGFGTPQGAKKSTEKFAANQLKQGLEKVAPDIAPLNARESRLIDTARAISKAVEREANNNQIYGVKSMVAGTLGGAAYAKDGDPASAAAMALATRAALHPAVASRAAIVASRLAKTAGVSTATAARLAYYAVSESEQEP